MAYIIKRCQKLSGDVTLQGSKHTYAAIMVGAAMSQGCTKIKNFPRISDSENMIGLLRELGVLIKTTNKETIVITNLKKSNKSIILSSNYISKFRDSIYILALAPLFKKMIIPDCFGGCLLGKRPITAQIRVLREFGYLVKYGKNSIKIEKVRVINKNRIVYLQKSVSVTKIAILLASSTRSKTVLKNIAIEPNVGDLISFLKKTGVKIKFISTDSISIDVGFKKYNKIINHILIPDRMEAVSFLCALLAVRGTIGIKNFDLNFLGDAKSILEKMGIVFTVINSDVSARCDKPVSCVSFKTGYYPLTCTDMHPLMAVPLLVAKGKSSIEETIFSKRWNYAKELLKMGAKWKLKNNILYIEGVGQLTGGLVHGHDIRCTAALIVAGLMARGKTVVTGEKYLNRAYDDFTNKLVGLGANIKYINE